MNGTLFTVPLSDGRAFIAHNRLEPDIDPLRGMAREDFMGWFFDRFREAYLAKKPETERLRLMELYYSGFHYMTAEQNRAMKVTNLCFSTVETVHPVMTEMKPRPEIIPRRQYQETEVTAVQEYAQWLMDSTEWDVNWHVNTREKLKMGWCVHLLVVDPRTGLCWPKAFSVFDFYPGAGSRNEDEMEEFFLARPVPTAWLRERYPHLADKIFSDNLVGPGYEVLEKPYFEQYGMGGDTSGLDRVVSGPAHMEGTADPGGGRALIPEADERQGATGTTMVVHGFFRDRRLMEVHYTGDIAEQIPGDVGFAHTPSARNFVRHEPYCESGWISIPFTAAGLMLDCRPLDPCFLGAPIEIGRDYAQAGRFYCPGEQDNIIPINRSINRRYNLLNRSLEYEAVPVLLADNDTGIDLDKQAVLPGDVLQKIRGSQIEWLAFGGASSHQFELLDLEKRDVDTVSGNHDVQQGRRPEGIEAASAIRNLQTAAQTRIRGKENPAFTEQSRLLRKMMVATGRKAKAPIWFRGTNGQMMSVDPAWLRYEYEIRFAQGTGSALGRAQNEEKYMGLRQAGMIDTQTALEATGVKNIPVVMQRLAAEAAIQSNMQGPSPRAA